MVHKLIRVECNRAEAQFGNTIYRVYDDGHVVAYGPEPDGPQPNLWIASLWSAHPLDDDSAVHVTHLAADSTWSDFVAALREWENGDE